MTFKIYILRCPITMEIRYVGQTVKTLGRRFNYHKNEVPKRTTHKTNWIDSLKKKGLLPIIELIHTCRTKEDCNKMEIFYIAHFKEMGAKLTNTTNGGEGNLGIATMKGKKMSEESKKKMSERLRGRKLSQETKDKISATLTGRKEPLETRLKKSQSRIGLKHSAETLLKMSAAQKGNQHWLGKKHSEETKRKIALNNPLRKNPCKSLV